MNRTGRMLAQEEVIDLLPSLNQAATGWGNIGSNCWFQIKHETHWTYDKPLAIGRPGSMIVFEPDGKVRFVPDAAAFAQKYDLPWSWGE